VISETRKGCCADAADGPKTSPATIKHTDIADFPNMAGSWRFLVRHLASKAAEEKLRFGKEFA
jgi:hypothetical protein